MLILTIRTDKPESEVGLFDDNSKLAYETWHAHRQLAETIHIKLKQLLKSAGKTWQDVEGVVVYAGPGSFTGLRIGMSVANALAYSLDISISAASESEWIKQGQKKLNKGLSVPFVVPKYGSAPNITIPKK